jgi:SAM-dependent methyltransferase
MTRAWDDFWRRQQPGLPRPSWSKRRIIQVLQPYLRPGALVLEAGCGSGFFSAFFLGQGCRVDALDNSTEALDRVRQNTNQACRRYWQEDLLHPDPELFAQAYDIVFTDGLLEHFTEEEQAAIVTNLRRAKKKQGKLITVVPNRFSPWQLLRPWFLPGVPERPFTLPRLHRVHRGMNILKSGGLNVLPLPNPWDGTWGKYAGMLLFVVAE